MARFGSWTGVGDFGTDSQTERKRKKYQWRTKEL
jgi:hypothetical protein